MVGLGASRLGGSGMLGSGKLGYGMSRRGQSRRSWRVRFWCVRAGHGLARRLGLGKFWRGELRLGWARLDKAVGVRCVSVLLVLVSFVKAV